MPAPAMVSCLFTLTVAVTGVDAAVIEIVSPAVAAATASAIVSQFGDPVVHVFEPSPGTSQVVAAAACVAVSRTSAQMANKERRIFIKGTSCLSGFVSAKGGTAMRLGVGKLRSTS